MAGKGISLGADDDAVIRRMWYQRRGWINCYPCAEPVCDVHDGVRDTPSRSTSENLCFLVTGPPLTGPGPAALAQVSDLGGQYHRS
jgi:hypothetical protein